MPLTKERSNDSDPVLSKPPLYRNILSIMSKAPLASDPTTINRESINPTNFALHLTPDQNHESNTTHRLLPAEHIASWHTSRSEEQQPLNAPPGIYSGPVPRCGMTTIIPRQELNAMQQNMDFSFLSPAERKIVALMRDIEPGSFFGPLLDSTNTVLLVQGRDLEKLQKAQMLVRTLPDREKNFLAADLHHFLTREGWCVLKVLLLYKDVQVTASTKGYEIGSDSGETNSGEQSVGNIHVGSRAADEKNLEAEIDEASTFAVAGGKTKREPVLKKDRASGLRGGGADGWVREKTHRDPARGSRGGGEDGWRRKKSYCDPARGSRSKPKLADDERVPSALWWFAGGRGRQAPTVGELRERRRSQTDHRANVDSTISLFDTTELRKSLQGESSRQAERVRNEQTYPQEEWQLIRPKKQPQRTERQANDHDTRKSKRTESMRGERRSSDVKPARSQAAAAQVEKPGIHGFGISDGSYESSKPLDNERKDALVPVPAGHNEASSPKQGLNVPDGVTPA